MEIFQPGDHVEFIDDKNTGIVINIIDKNTLLISIDGLDIPVLKSQLIKINSKSGSALSLNEKYQEDLKPPKPKSSVERTGIFVSMNKSDYPGSADIYLINDSDFTLFYTFYSEKGNEIHPLRKGQLDDSEHVMLIRQNIENPERIPKFTVCLLFFSSDATEIKKPLIFSFTPSVKSLSKTLTPAPLTRKLSHLIKIPTTAPPPATVKPVIPATIPELPKKEIVDIEIPVQTIDLHIEEINPEFQLMTRNEIFNFQFSYFVNSIEKGIASGYKSMIFIHGIGVSTLKNKIVEYLKNNEHVKDFGEADIRKFGYGATEVFLG